MREETATEMQRVIAGLTRELPGRYETAGAVLKSLLTSATYSRPFDYPTSLHERYNALMLSDLQAETAIVQPESLIWLVVGDLSKIYSQLEALDIAPVEIWDTNGNPVSPGL